MNDQNAPYELADGEARSRESPDTFFMPDREDRENLEVGDIVKLIFEGVSRETGESCAERMWVEVTHKVGGRFQGILTNEPFELEDLQELDSIEFGPEHVVAMVDDRPYQDEKILVGIRVHQGETTPGIIYREEPMFDRDSGWRAFVGDETPEEVSGEAAGEDEDTFLPQSIEYFLGRWPAAEPVLQAGAEGSHWEWDEHLRVYSKTKA